jgi:adenine/guanine phosphoribosyltransferase-like PRPP-binding protein
MKRVTSYLGDGLSGRFLARAVPEMAKELRRKRISFKAIAFRGVSGALFGPCLAAEMKRGLIVVRKSLGDEESTHSGHKVEGMICDKYIIVDDFISSGNTVSVIENKIKEFNPEARLVAVVTFLSDTHIELPSIWGGTVPVIGRAVQL